MPVDIVFKEHFSEILIVFPFVETHGCASPGEESPINSLKIKNKKIFILSSLGDSQPFVS